MTDQRERVSLCGRERLSHVLGRSGRLRVTVMGIGRFGGGIGAARYFAGRGDMVTVTDLKPDEKLGAAKAALAELPLVWQVGGHAERDFEAADLIVASPAVPRWNHLLRTAAAVGVPITSEMNLFLTLCRARIAAVTGSNGKSTTTALLAHMAGRGAQRCLLGGNIGASLLPDVHRIEPDDLVVLELSSFQLEDAAHIRWSPEVAVVTNLTPNHLDRHGSFAAYCAAKRNILRGQDACSAAVLNADCPNLRLWVHEVGERGQWFSVEGPVYSGAVLDGSDMVFMESGREQLRLRIPGSFSLKGRHNKANALAAALAARSLGTSVGAIGEALGDFQPLEHRLEFVAEVGGIAFYNDSIATTPESVIAGLRSFGPSRPITLIAGGYDKKIPLDVLAREAARRVDLLVTIGQTGPAIAEQVRQACAPGCGPRVVSAGSLSEAVETALKSSASGAAVLLSPACASYDMFENFEQRGRLFKELVHAMAQRASVAGKVA